METSSKEFRDVAPAYMHKRAVIFDSGAKVKNLENVIYISLDTYKERGDNEINSELDAWLTFFTAEKPKDVLRLLDSHPEFLPMYKEIAEFRKKPWEVISMFSEALRIMDRNTTKYMIDELNETITELMHDNNEKDQTISELMLGNNEKDQTISDQNQTISDQNLIIKELRKRISELEQDHS